MQSSMAKSFPLSESVATAGSHKHLLLAEDDPVNQEVAALFLETLGYSCDAVGNGSEALHALAERDYDLVLMDCMMPVMGGFEATGIIRSPESNVRNHAVPVIALTGRATSDSFGRCLAAGMNDYLSKPYRIHELDAMLAKWLPGSPQKYGSGEYSQAGLQEQLADDEVLALFVAKAPEYVAALQSSLIEGNAPGVCHNAHKLSGAAAAIGAGTVADLAAEMEELGTRNELSKAEQKQQQLSEAFENLLAMLTRRS